MSQSLIARLCKCLFQCFEIIALLGCGIFHRLFFSLTDYMRNHYIAAQRNADKQVDDQPDEGAVCTDGCNGYRAVLLRKIADNRKIRSVEQLLQNCRRRDRYRKLRQSFP